MTLILASTSSIRAAILANAGIAFIVQPPAVDESEIKARSSSLPAPDLALCLAEAKCLSLSMPANPALILGADQVLVCGGRIYDKPASPAEARSHLGELNGKQHQLISALCCCRAGQVIWTNVSAATLTMRECTEHFLDQYVAGMGDSITTSVGAYKLEGVGIQLFEKIDGDYFTILGLPILPLIAFLREQGEIPA